MTAKERYLPLDEYVDTISILDQACHDFDHEKIRSILIEAPTDFEPTDGIGDLVWNARKRQARNDITSNVVTLRKVE